PIEGYKRTFEVNNAVTLALTPDGKYAFVAGYNLQRQDDDDPSHNHGVPQSDPAGSTIGVIQMDDEKGPRLVAATRAIPGGFPWDLAISPDGTYLYATYLEIPTDTGPGAVFVYNIPAIRSAVEQLQGDKINSFRLRRSGIDDLDPKNPGTISHNV